MIREYDAEEVQPLAKKSRRSGVWNGRNSAEKSGTVTRAYIGRRDYLMKKKEGDKIDPYRRARHVNIHSHSE